MTLTQENNGGEVRRGTLLEPRGPSRCPIRDSKLILIHKILYSWHKHQCFPETLKACSTAEIRGVETGK